MDRETQDREMRKLGAAPDYIIGSAHAVTEDGQVVAIDLGPADAKQGQTHARRRERVVTGDPAGASLSYLGYSTWAERWGECLMTGHTPARNLGRTEQGS